jgi:hypothetical protein
MRRLTTMMIAGIVAVLAMSALATAAFAVNPELLPGTRGTTWEGSNGKATLDTERKGTIECEANADKGELTNTKEGTFTIRFKMCTVFGVINAHSLGDKANEILVGGTTLLCTINTSPLEVGIVLHPKEVHIEVSTKLVLVKGWVIGRFKLLNATEAELNFEQTRNGVQTIQDCVDNNGVELPRETLLTREGAGAFENSSEVANGTIDISAAQTLMS